MTSVVQEGADATLPSAGQLRASQELVRAARALADAVVRLPPEAHTESFLDRLLELSRDMEARALPRLMPWYYDDAGRRAGVKANGGATADPRDEDLLSDYNPMIPPLRLTVQGSEATGTVRVGPAFTGPPGRVHGGVLATIMDHAMGMLVSRAAQPSVTARLEMNYRGGAPIESELNVSVRISERAGRKTWVDAEIRFAGELCVSARGLFVGPAAA